MKSLQLTESHYNELELLEQLLPLNHKKILELGCGKAEKTRKIVTKGEGRQIIATEVDAVQHGKNLKLDDLPNVQFIESGAQYIPLDDGSIDIVLMFKSLHHVPMEQMDQALSEIERVLKSGGYAYISEPVYAGAFNEMMCLFHDEKIVRAAAYKAIETSIDGGIWAETEELFFNTQLRFKDFSEFDQRMLQVTHTDHALSPEVLQEVKEKFSSNMKNGRVEFLVPNRVNLLRKKYQ